MEGLRIEPTGEIDDRLAGEAMGAERRRLADLVILVLRGRSCARLAAGAAAEEHRPLLPHHHFAVLVHQLEPHLDDADVGARARQPRALSVVRRTLSRSPGLTGFSQSIDSIPGDALRASSAGTLRRN